jgi:hypothetical protein
MIMLMAPPSPGQPPPRPYQADTSSDGTFRFEGLPPGRYRVSAQKAGYAIPGPGSPPPAIITLEAGGPAASQVIALQRGGVIAGRVLSPTGEPMAEARVTAMRRPPGAPGGRLMMAGPGATANDLGEFRLHSLPPGDYYIQASPRFEPPNARSAPVASVTAPTFYPGTTDAASAQLVTIGAGATLNGIEIGLLRAPAYSIKGIVVDEDGRPVANAAIMLMPDPVQGIPPFAGPSRPRSAADGSFAMEGVRSGSYRLSAASPIVSKGDRTGARTGISTGISTGLSGGLTTAGGGIRFGSGGGPLMTETVNGVTTEYRFDTAGEVAIVVRDDHVTGLQVIAKRPAQ